MRWIALHLPSLSLEAFSATLPGGQEPPRPVALLAAHRIAAADERAQAAGVRPGQKRATALALAPELVLGQADTVRDAQALQAAAHAALAFTPAVAVEPGDCIVLEVAASLRLFGGMAALLARLHEALAPLGHRLCLAVAPTAGGAALLARWTEAQGAHDFTRGEHTTRLPALHALLDTAPVWLLGPGREHWEALQGMGLHTLADLRALPRSGLARRFGEGLLTDLDRALGLAPDPRRWLTLPPVFDSRLELNARADNAEQLLHAAGHLLARLVAWAQAQQARVAGFVLRMLHEPRHRQGERQAPHTDLALGLAEPSVDAAHLQAVLRERLTRLQLPAPTLELRLHCSQLHRSPAPNGELFPTRQSEQQGLARLLERLRARLGDEQVLQLQAGADHRPEHASRLEPLRATVPGAASAMHGAVRGAMSGAMSGVKSGAVSSSGAGPAPGPRRPLPRPAWLLPEPLPLSERQALPLLDGQPLQLVGGPERIEAGWWDGQLATRDYFIAQAGDGALVWIFRTRLPGLEEDAAGWYLQGRFG